MSVLDCFDFFKKNFGKRYLLPEKKKILHMLSPLLICFRRHGIAVKRAAMLNLNLSLESGLVLECVFDSENGQELLTGPAVWGHECDSVMWL